MGDWLVDKGLDAPRAARPKAPSLNALRRRQGQQYRSAPFGPPHASASRAMGKQARPLPPPAILPAIRSATLARPTLSYPPQTLTPQATMVLA